MTTEMRPDPSPQYVLWEITRRCNLRCAHCLTRSGNALQSELSTDQALQVCDQLADVDVGAVALMGGEPLVRRDWPELVSRLRGHGIDVGLVTNGILFDEPTATRARELGCSQVVVSLDGTRSVHEELRGPGTFEAAVSALQSAELVGIPNRMVVTSVHKKNVLELDSMLTMLSEVAPGISWAINFTSIRHNSRMDEAHRIDLPTYLEVIRFIERSRAHSKGLVEILPSHDMGYHSDCSPDFPMKGWAGCLAGMKTLGISADGAVKGCLVLPDSLIEGSVPDSSTSLKELWNDPDRFAYNRQFREEDLRGACRGCEKGFLCRGGCLEFSITMTGEPHRAPFCLGRIEKWTRKNNDLDA